MGVWSSLYIACPVSMEHRDAWGSEEENYLMMCSSEKFD